MTDGGVYRRMDRNSPGRRLARRLGAEAAMLADLTFEECSTCGGTGADDQGLECFPCGGKGTVPVWSEQS